MRQSTELARRRELLRRLEGTWTGEETLAPSPWAATGTATGHMIFAPALGGVILTQQYARNVRDRPASPFKAS
ncbi:hypothetical protein [Deinococcus hopiensis]|uniref:hypothetical protein n=1 Tax=Deinococcus hopiensis TaxID=309885 RepID=UPI0009FD81FD|nr:hypothetical protein [Deinococcus hopiensis]